jgi:hypothetical protein
MINWDEILADFAHKCGDGGPDMTNPRHLALLRESLIKFGWKENATNEFLGNLREGKEIVTENWWDDLSDAAQATYIEKHGSAPNVAGDAAGGDAVGGEDEDDKAPDSRGVEDDELPKTKEQKEEEARQKSEEVRAKIYPESGTLIGDDPKTPADQSDREIKQLCLEHGYKDFEKNSGRGKPAPGNAGSMFNEVISGEGTSILEQEPDLTEEELTRVLYDQFCGTKLGAEVKGSDLDTGVGVGDIPSDVKGPEKGCYSKCLVTARSAKRKHQRVQESVESVRESGGDFEEPTKTHSFYGHGDSLEAQVAIIQNALNSDPPKKVYAPDGTEITKRPGFMTENELYALILKGGKGGNPSDTATFVEDANGNLILNFTSDKMTTSDQQANSTLINEINNRKKTVEGMGLSPDKEEEANVEIDRHKEEVDVEQQKLKKIVAPVGEQMLKDADANHPQATDDFIDDWESNDDTSAHWKVWQAAIAKDNGWTPPLSQEQKRCAARLLMKVTSGEADRPIDPKTDRPQRGSAPDVAVSSKAGSGQADCKTKRWLSNDMAKIPARSATRQHGAGKEGYDIKQHIETIRRNIIRMERNHLAKLNEIKVMVDGKEKGLGELIEGQQIVDQLHFQMMDEDDQGHPIMSHGLFEVNMGGHPVNKKVLQECLAEGNSDFDSEDFIQGFKVMAPDVDEPGDRYTWSCPLPSAKPKKGDRASAPVLDKSGEVTDSGSCKDGSPRRATGRVMFIYAVTEKGLVKVAQKNMRTKTGDLGNYDTTVTYHKEMQECIERESA